MPIKLLFIVGTLCTIVAFAAGLAHALSLPHKIALGAEDYLRVQQLYRGWAFLGVASLGAPVIAIVLAWLLRGETIARNAMIMAACCTVLALAVFFIWTFPANRATQEWTMLPEGWQTLRARWEWSHVAGAVLNGIAVVAEIVGALGFRPKM
jgi:hypothetical protein